MQTTNAGRLVVELVASTEQYHREMSAAARESVSYGNAAEQAQKDARQLGSQVDKTGKEVDGYSRDAKEARQATDKLSREARAAQKEFKNYSQSAKKAGDETGRLGDKGGAATGKLASMASGLGTVARIGGIVTAVFSAAAAAAAATAKAANSVLLENAALAREWQAQASVAGIATGRLQEFAHAVRTVGVDTDKAADILKDFRDKVGDYAATGGGEFADFFENVGNAAGLTAEKLQTMAGPEGLVAVKKALDDANISAGEQVFYFEALANDAARLIPLLSNNGSELNRMTAEFRELNSVMTESEMARLGEYEADVNALKGSWSALVREAVMPFADELQTASKYFREIFSNGRIHMAKGSLNTAEQDVRSIASEIADLLDDIDTLNKGGVVKAIRYDGDNMYSRDPVEERVAQRQKMVKDLEEDLRAANDELIRWNDHVKELNGELDETVKVEIARTKQAKELAKAEEDALKAAQGRARAHDSLYNKIFGAEDNKPKEFVENKMFELSAEHTRDAVREGPNLSDAVRMIQNLDDQAAGFRGNDRFDYQGMQDVVALLRDEARQRFGSAFDDATNKRADAPAVLQWEGVGKSIDLIAESNVEMTELVKHWLEENDSREEAAGETNEKFQTLLKEQQALAKEQQALAKAGPEKIGSIDITVMAGGKQLSSELTGDPEFLRALKKIVEQQTKDTARAVAR